MHSFNSQADIEKYFRSGKGADNVGFSIDRSQINKLLKEEAGRLQDIIKTHILYYYRSYSPTEYVRTHRLLDSVKVDVVKTKDGFPSIDVYFDDECVHPSVMGGESGFTATLLNYGWNWSPVRHRFSYFEGYDFVEYAVNEFIAGNPYGLKVTVKAQYGSEVIDYREFI